MSVMSSMLAAWDALWITLVAAAVVVAVLVILARCFVRVPQGKALIRRGLGGAKVSMTGLLVLPGLQRKQWMDISGATVELDCRGDGAVKTADGQLIELRAAFTLRVCPTPESILQAAGRLPAGLGHAAAVAERFRDALFAAVHEVIGAHARAELLDYENRATVHRELSEALAGRLDGFELDDVAVEYFEPVREDQLADSSS